MDEDIEVTRDLHMRSVLLGVYPYILIQLELHRGGWRIGVDYELLTPEEVIATLEEVIEDVRNQEWI